MAKPSDLIRMTTNPISSAKGLLLVSRDSGIISKDLEKADELSLRVSAGVYADEVRGGFLSACTRRCRRKRWSASGRATRKRSSRGESDSPSMRCSDWEQH